MSESKMDQKEQKIKIVNLKRSYKDNIRSTWKSFSTVDEVMADVNDKSTCTLEVLDKNENMFRKLYFDIENIPKDKENMIYDLINDISDFLKIDKDQYALTYNSNSHAHPGLSYHLYFPYKMNYLDMKKLVVLIKTKYPQYADYIDDSVYSSIRLFRLPNNGKVTGRGVNNNDFHQIVKGQFNETLIQMTDELPEFDQFPDNFKSFDCSKALKAMRKERKKKCITVSPNKNPRGNAPKKKKARQSIVIDIAKKLIGSSSWNKFYKKGNFLPGEPKCNLFVAEVLEKAGFNVPYTNKAGKISSKVLDIMNESTDRPLTAKDWYDGKCPGTTLVGRGAEGLEKSWPGDIITDGSHIGIISGPQKTISASSKPLDLMQVIENDWGWKPNEIPNIVIYRYHP